MNDRILKFADSRQFIGRIARSGENNTRSMAFDCSTALAEYPTAQIIAVIQRPQGDPYTVTPDAEGTIRRITLTSYDLEFNGHLQIELRVIDGEKILKSAIYTATIDDSIRGEADAPGQPVRDVLDRLDAEIKQAQAVVNDIRQKLENGEFNGSDANVTAENIQSALGYAPVKDVQVAGSSVLVDGVANVPIATKTVNGVMRPDFYGVGVNHAGILYVQNTSNINITNRVPSAPLTAYNLDYAVKAAMCDGKGAAWTSAEQKAARERMGVDKPYELIESITTDGISIIERSQEPDGTSYNFVAIKVSITSPKNLSAVQTVYARIFFGEQSNATYSMYRENLDYFYRSTYTWKKENNVVTGNVNIPTIIYATQGGNGGDYAETRMIPEVVIANGNFTKLKIYTANNMPISAGFLIQIYGVRA